MTGASPASRVRILAAILVLIVTGVIATIVLIPSDQAPRAVATAPVRGRGGSPLGDQQIVPGVRVGDVWVGDHIDEVRPHLGKVEIAPRKDLLIYSGAELDVGVRRDRVQMVVIKSPRFKTQEGIAVGGSVTPVIEALGRGYEYTEKKPAPLQYVLDYWDRGISFTTERDVITQIKIFSALGSPARE